MAWQDDCNSPLSRYRASQDDNELNDAEFSVKGVNSLASVKMKANRAILSMASPVLKTLFYGSLAVKMGVTIPINDGTERGFKTMLEFIYNEGEYSINDLLGGKENVSEWDDLEKVLELLYFGHKYQINSILNFGRDILLQKMKIKSRNVMKIHRKIAAYRTILNSEYCIVNYATNEFIGNEFETIFKLAKVKYGMVFLPEDLMVEVLKRKSLGNVTEEFVLQVALNYLKFCQDKDWREKYNTIQGTCFCFDVNGYDKTDLAQRFNQEGRAVRIITEVIDFSKLALDDVDLNQVSAFLPADVVLKMQTAMITSYKNGLRASVVRKENPADYTINLAKMPLQQLPARKTSQIKFKVDKKCFILFSEGQWSQNTYNAPTMLGGLSTGDPGKLLISNLSMGVTESDIHTLFSHRKSSIVNYDKSGRSRGTAEVVYDSKSDAIEAMTQFNGKPLDGRPMRIEITAPSVEDLNKKINGQTQNNVNYRHDYKIPKYSQPDHVDSYNYRHGYNNGHPRTFVYSQPSENIFGRKSQPMDDMGSFSHGHTMHSKAQPMDQSACKQIVWKQNGTSKQEVRGQDAYGHKFFADSNAEVTVDFEMNNSSITYSLEMGQFKKVGVELTLLEVNGESLMKEAAGERAKKRKANEDATTNKGLHVVNFTILPV